METERLTDRQTDREGTEGRRWWERRGREVFFFNKLKEMETEETQR